MGLSVNPEPETQWLRYSYTSLTTPATTYELNVVTGERKLLKQQPVIGFDASKYVTERVWAPARDGCRARTLQRWATAALATRRTRRAPAQPLASPRSTPTATSVGQCTPT